MEKLFITIVLFFLSSVIQQAQISEYILELDSALKSTAIVDIDKVEGLNPNFNHEIMPTLGCWFWVEADFEPYGFKPFIDKVSLHSPFNYLTTSIRAPNIEVTNRDVHNQIKAAAEYAVANKVPIIMDLDVRLARRAFEAEYPDELQEMLILNEVEITSENDVETTIRSIDLSDHYTHNTTHYIPLRGSLLRVYSYSRDSLGINPESLKEITDECKIVSSSKDSVKVLIPKDKQRISNKACIMVSFTHLTPDVFAPHLMDFQRRIIEQYSDVQLAGVCKDEWGFPPNFTGNPDKNQFWYSKHRALAYKERTNGRDLLEDCLLMNLGIVGKEKERQMVINHFMEMSFQRNGELENDFYNTVKEVFGNNGIVATHPTWWPYPDLREFKKNGLDWWVAKRDWAQTDELTPFAVRTALSKKWNSSVWYNMYYSKEQSDYVQSVWSSALAGGRVNYHQPYPVENPEYPRVELLRGKLMRIESRVRLLNYITKSPLDCSVAVIFGHANAMNWAGANYNDVGMEIADKLWSLGFPTDLIPSSEIENESLYIDDNGWICYGPQLYSAIILYNPEFEKLSTASFFNRVKNNTTALYRIGEWTKNFDGQEFSGVAALPKTMLKSDINSIIGEITSTLQKQNIYPQTPSTSKIQGFGHSSSSPPTTGFCRLIDGTIIQIAATDSVTGDPIQSQINIGEHVVTFDAVGVAAVRLDHDGRVQSLAAGGLKYFEGKDLEIKFDIRVDIALWRDKLGNWEGVFQGDRNSIPLELLKITKNWSFIDVPDSLP